MRRLISIVLSIFLLAPLAGVCFAEPQIARVTRPAGFLQMEGDRWLAAERGQTLQSGSSVRTLEGGSLVVEDGASGAILQVAEKSSVSFHGASESGVFQYKVKEGSVTFHLKQKIGLDVDTPLVVFAVRGTVFTVTTSLEEGVVDLRVDEGRVETTDVTGRTRSHLPDKDPSLRVALAELKISDEVRQIYRERLDRLMEKERAADDLLRLSLTRTRDNRSGGGGEKEASAEGGKGSPGGDDGGGDDDDNDDGNDNDNDDDR